MEKGRKEEREGGRVGGKKGGMEGGKILSPLHQLLVKEGGSFH